MSNSKLNLVGGLYSAHPRICAQLGMDREPTQLQFLLLIVLPMVVYMLMYRLARGKIPIEQRSMKKKSA